MSQWLKKLKKKTQDLPPDEPQEPQEAPFSGFRGALPVGIEKNQTRNQTYDKGAPIHVQSDILDTDLWIVPDNFFDTPVYTDSEIQELAHLNLSAESLKAVHMVKTTFEGVIVDAEAYPVPLEMFSHTPPWGTAKTARSTFLRFLR